MYQVDVFVAGESTTEVPDLSGFEAITEDGHKIGQVEQATTMGEKSWIVVDTGHWIFGKKRMIPAGLVDSIDLDDRQVVIALSRDAVKAAPDFDEIRRHEAFYQGQLDDYYREHVSPRQSL
jgi:hypothetical protein